MISNFKIESFRLFDNIEINSLRQVNLIVGKNSSGKSALLEAFLLYFSNVSPEVLMERIYSRQEHWESPQNKYSQDFTLHPIRHLFKGHIIPEVSEVGFTLASNQKSLHVRTAAYFREENENGVIKNIHISDEDIDGFDPDSVRRYLVVESNGSTKNLFSLENGQRDIRRRAVRLSKEDSVPCLFVPTNGISDTQSSLLWDGISLTDLEKEVLKGIKLIEPQATGITFVDSGNGMRSDSRMPLVKISNISEPVPLKSLGDGMTRIFQIILSLVSAKDGILIVDEFENGLHWSIQNEVWNIVFKLAKRLNVQVFCSTHSRDCINSFETIWKTNKKSGSFIRVSKNNDCSSIREYDLELLSDSLDTEVEVR